MLSTAMLMLSYVYTVNPMLLSFSCRCAWRLVGRNFGRLNSTNIIPPLSQSISLSGYPRTPGTSNFRYSSAIFFSCAQRRSIFPTLFSMCRSSLSFTAQPHISPRSAN